MTKQKKLMKYIFRTISIIILVNIVLLANAQDRFDELKTRLDGLAEEMPGLNQKIDISVNGASIQEFIRGIANNASININVDPALNIKIINNFSQVKVADIILYLAREYKLDINTIGSILTIKLYDAPKPDKKLEYDRIIITYDAVNDFLSYELVNDTLSKVLKEVTRLSGKNVVIPSGLNNKIVNGYIQNMPFESVIEKLALTNGLIYEKTDDNFYYISEKGIETKKTESNSASGDNKSAIKSFDNKGNQAKIKVFGINNISVFAQEVPIAWLIKQVSDTLGINYVFVNEFEEKKNINISNLTYDEFLFNLLEGTKYASNKVKNVYIIGESKNAALVNTAVVQLQYRSVDKVSEHIPEGLREGMGIKEFGELNSLVLTGNPSKIEVLKNFIADIDKVVPVILIEVMFIDYNKRHEITTGISAGVGQNPVPGKQTIMPGIDYSFSTQSINNLLAKFEGYGWFNLGKVSSDFYLSIKALETNGIIDVRSTPKLSTLNGHEASMRSGEKKYYKEEQSNYIGTQNPSLANSYKWIAIDADLSLTIKPFVSGDEYITLEVDVNQTEFTPREFDDSPPGSVTRHFNSLIRMKDGEMILLGGLEKEKSQNIGSGTPLLSRIPILKWLFSSKTKGKEESRLNIFIKPTIIF